MKDAAGKKILVGVVIAGLVFGSYSFGKYQGDEGDDLADLVTPQTAEDKQIDAEIEAEEAAAVTVRVSDSGFEPSTVTIKKGQTIMWVNESVDDVMPVYSPYALEEVFGAEEGDMPEDADGWELSFTKAGTYEYYDGLHPEKKGTVVVEE